LHFTRANTYANTFALDGGLLRFSDVDGTGNTLSGSLTGTGTVAFTGPGVSTVTAGAVYDAGATLIDTGTVAFDVADATTANLTLTDGTLTGAGTLLVTGTSTWNGTGAMLGTGTTQLGGIAQLTIEGAGTRRLGEQRTLSNAASIVWTGGDIAFDGDAALVNSGNLLIDNAGAVSMNTTGGAPLFFSSGALAKIGAGTATIGVSTALQGSGSVAAGVLAFTAPTTQGAAFTITDPGVLSFGADSSLAAAGSLAGDGTLQITNGTFELVGTREIALGGVSVTGGVLDGADDAFVLASGLDLAGGSLLAGSIAADGATATFAGGSLTAGALDLDAGSAAIGGATVTVDGAVTAGTLTLSSGSLTAGALAVDSATLAGGSTSVSGASSFTTALTVDGGTLQTGTLSLASGSTTTLSGGAVTVTGDATADGLLTLAGGSLNVGALSLGGTLAGSGTITGDVTNAGLVSAGASPGTISIDGDYTQTSLGRILIELDGTTATAGSDFDLLAISGVAALDGTLEFAALGAYDPTLGDLLVPITWGSVTGAFADVIQPTAFAIYDPVVGATGLETTLVELNGIALGDETPPISSNLPELVAEQQGTTIEEIETTQEVVELGAERRRTQEACDDAQAPEEGGDDGRQGVACRSI
ncbi:MAG TPA: hypothetical protein VLA56_13585, partial [Pseudomonadales bacterium]|nr:hypothetical protein [Pseudomonadales bacterium]